METSDETVETTEPTTTVEVPEPEETSESEDKTPTDRPSRKERREAKKTDFNAELRARDEQIQRLRDESLQRDSRRDAELAELRGRLSERERATAKDPYAEQIAEIEKAAKADLRAAAAMMEKNPQEAERLVDEHNKKLRQIARLEFKQEQDAERAESQRNAPPILPPAVQHDVIRVAQEFPWIQTHARARAATDALIDEMTANGAPANFATMKAAAAQVAVAFGLGGEAPPTDAQRQRYRGVGAGAAAGNGDGKRTVEMGRTEMALARALANREGNGASDEEARARWAQRVGSRLVGREG